MFKARFILLLTCLGLMLPVSAADLEKGISDLNRGEFISALAEFTPLAESGYAPAQYQLSLMHKTMGGRPPVDLAR